MQRKKQVGVIIDSFAAGDEVRKMDFTPYSVKVYQREMQQKFIAYRMSY
jgi:hypothetical protein